jgi:photosystem II stability/assembly factor-like uncharacterized protein
MKGRVLAATTGAAALLLAGCSTAGTSAPTEPPAQATSSGSAAPVQVDGAAWEHVHGLALDGQRLVVGTHQGLWGQDPGQKPVEVSDTAFDVMGLALDGDRWLASGHPAAGQDAPPDLGLQASTDEGVTWAPVSLEGEVDFHRLVAAADTVMGMSAHDGTLLRSTDGGTTWDGLGTPALFDLAVDPAKPKTVVATTQQGPVRSTDGGITFTPIPDAPLVALLAWTNSTLYGLAPDGTLQASTDGGTTWEARGNAGSGQPAALAADGDTVVALTGSVVTQSSDGGASFTPRLIIAGAQGH